MYISLFEKLTINSLVFILHNSEARGLAEDSMHTFNASDASDFEEKELVFDFCAPVWSQGHITHLQARKLSSLAGSKHSLPMHWGEPNPGAVPGALSASPVCDSHHGPARSSQFLRAPVLTLHVHCYPNLDWSGEAKNNQQKFKLALAKIAVFCCLYNHLHFLQQLPSGAKVLQCSFCHCTATATFL